MSLLNKLGLHRPELRAWALYDWANSAFITTVISAVFPIYFSILATRKGGLTSAQATAWYGTTTTIAMALAALLAPCLGAIGDRAPIKKKLLGGFLLLGASATMALFFAPWGGWQLAAWLFALGNLGSACSLVFYDALLPHIARPDEMDRVSTAAYALGYVGGGLLLALQLLLINNPQLIGLENSEIASRVAFVSVGLWWLIFAIPLFRKVSEPPVLLPRSGASSVIGEALKGFLGTLRELKKYRQAFLFLIAFLIFNDGIGTIIRMAVIFGTELKFSPGTLIAAILLTQFVGIPFAFGFGLLATQIGAKRSIYLGLSVYCGISIFGYFMDQEWHFLTLAILVGSVQGGTQALSRSLFASLIPKAKSSEFFGLFAVFERFAGIAGPLIFTYIVSVTGSSRAALPALIGFFIVGMVLLSFVDVSAGRKAAAESPVP